MISTRAERWRSVKLIADGVITRKGKSLHIHDRARLDGLAADLATDWGEDFGR